MDTAETVVEDIRTDAAIDAARVVAEPAVGAVMIVAAEVDAVGAELAEHAEASEERHDEILGDTEWLKTQLGQLLTISQTMLSTLAVMQAAITSEFLALRTVTESTVTPPSPQASLETIPVVEPVAVVVAQEVVETPPGPARRRRRAI